MSQELTPIQRKALYLLAEGISVSAVAQYIKVRRETVSRWRQLPVFKAEYDQCMRTMHDQLQHRITCLTDHVLQRFILDVHSNSFDSWDMFKLLDKFMDYRQASNMGDAATNP